MNTVLRSSQINESQSNSIDEFSSGHTNDLIRKQIKRPSRLSSSIDSIKKNNLYHNSIKQMIKTISQQLVAIIFLCCCSIPAFTQKNMYPEMQQKVRETLKENAQTIRFMENKGQIRRKEVLYYFEGKQGSVYIEKNKIVFVAVEMETIKKKFLDDQVIIKGKHTFTLNIDGANPEPTLQLGESFKTRYNFIRDEDANKWVRGVQAAKDLTLEEIYPGISLRLYSTNDGALEFDWIMQPGADYKKIKFDFQGQDSLKVASDGSLSIGLRFTDVRLHIPESYQVTENGKVPVNFAFVKSASNEITFETKSAINPAYPLIIDPTLSWGTYMDGDGNPGTFDQYLYAIELDTNDMIVYCAGATNVNIDTNQTPYDANGYLNNISGFLGQTPDNTPYAVVVYRISSDGTNLLDMTLYGPSSMSVGNLCRAHALSLSENRVFIGGVTNVALPLVGSSFDATRSGTDGFVAVFSKDLGTLYYSTYLGSTGTETDGVTTVRALSDTSYVCGFSTAASLMGSPTYVPTGMAQSTYGGTSDFWIGKFSGLNTLAWGTYMGGAQNDFINDLEVFSDGRVAFIGRGFSTLTRVNTTNAGRSTVTTNLDGMIGVLNSTGTAFLYLDEIGGANNDQLHDVEVIGSTLYWTGQVSSGFPTSTGAYDVSQNGNFDVVVGSMNDNGGSGNYKATFYGTSTADIGNCLKQVTQTSCSGGGGALTFLLVWGTVNGTGLPTVNLNNESFYDASWNGGTDMFFAGFTSDLDTLIYGTYVGGSNNDYLGNIGVPIGANHLDVFGSNIYIGTTTHSTSHTPVIVSGGFDPIKSNSGNDSHVIYEIELPSIIETDYSDAPLWLGKPSHTIDCENLSIGSVDNETGSQHTNNADGDDDNGFDDENGVASPPSLTAGGPQTISITVDSITNTTGQTANLYAWINLNGSTGFGFEAAEFQSTTVANGFSGSKTLTWTNVTISGPDSNKYLRIRLTTNNLIDDVSSPRDERAYSSASNGEVEDYSMVELNCPAAYVDSACLPQSTIDAHFAAWLASAGGGGGCDGILTNNNTGAPTYCGEIKTVTFTYISTCNPDTTQCTSTFAIYDTMIAPVVLNCPTNKTEAACQTQASINTKFNTWLATASASGGCNLVLSNNNNGAPSACGGTKTVIFTATSGCEPPKTCSATFTVLDSFLVLTCPSNVTEAACQTQASINTKYTNWLNTVSTGGGCNAGSLTNNSTGAPSACGGSKTVTFTAINECDTVTCMATFAVDSSPVVLTCASNVTEAACQTQAAINTKFNNWLATTTFTGGCSASLSNNNSGAPPACGGSKTVTFTVTSTCGATKTCTASFTVTAPSPVGVTCPANQTEAACQTQAAIDTKFTTWLGTAGKSGGCNAVISNNNTGAPPACGGSRTVVFTVTSDCADPITCSAVFTVTTAPAVVLNCASNQTEAACQTQASINTKFNTWLATTTFSGGCNATLSNNNSGAPNACGGTVTVTFTVTSSCEANKTCSATFTVQSSPVVLTCPSNQTEAACQTQAAINTKFTTWLGTATKSGGCNATLSNNNSGAPPACGGTVTVTFTVTSTCEANKTCSATFTVQSSPVVLTCASNQTEAACQTQAAINTKFTTWLATASFTGGCNGTISNNNTGAPNACGGSKTVTFTVTSSCEANKTCSAVFTVSPDTPPVITGQLDTIEVDGGCGLEDLPPPVTTVAALEAFGVTITDCTPDNLLVVTSSDVIQGECPALATRTYFVTDACNNSSSAIQIILVRDTVKPTFTKPANITLYKSGDIPDTATIVNYDFNQGTSYATLCPIVFSGIKAVVDASSNAYSAVTGTTSGNLAFSNNNVAGKGLKVDSSHQTGHWQFNLTGAGLTKGTNFKVYVQAFKNATKSADTLKMQYSENGISWTTFRTKPLTVSTWVQDTASIPGIANPDTLYIRVTYSGGMTGVGNKALYIDNFQVRSILCCTYEATPAITGDVTNESDNCSSNLNATFCDSVATTPCEGSTLIYRTWMLEDSCGNSADDQIQLITISDTSKPTFTAPPPYIIYKGGAVSDTHTIVNYNFNRGQSYDKLVPYLYWGIKSEIDTSSVVFKTDTGTVTGPLAYSVNNVAGRSMRVDSSNKPGHWQFNIGGMNLPACHQIAVYAQAKMHDAQSADTLHFEYSLNDTVWTKFNTFQLSQGNWVEDTATVPINFTVDTLFLRITYSGSSGGSGPKTLLIDNFQIHAYFEVDSCSYDANPLITGYPTMVKDNCDTMPTVDYTDMVTETPCEIEIIRTWIVTDDCGNSTTKNQEITVQDTTGPVITCPANVVTIDCEASVDPNNTGFATGYDQCTDADPDIDYTDVIVPGPCDGDYTINRTWIATDSCGNTSTCLQTINVDPLPGPFLTCASNVTEAACQTQAAINSKFTAWLATATFTGGCDATISNNNTGAPSNCGGVKTVTFTVTSDCSTPKTCSATFTVTAAPAVTLTCASNVTEAACQTQAAINSKFSAWLATTTFSGGCNATLSNNNIGAPPACGGTTTVTFTVTSSCEPNKTCSAIFGVSPSTTIALTCASNVTEAACQTQAAINTKFNTWLATATFTGGCSATISNNNTGAPLACGGTKTVTFTVTSTCEPNKTCSATFTVTNAPAVVLTCPANQTEAACQTQAAINSKFATWLTTATFSGGCNATISNNSGSAPLACGGTATVTFTVTSTCEPNKTCSATFAVTTAPIVVLNCPANQTEAACQTQAAINTKFATWLTTATFSGGCNAAISNNSTTAPLACGGTATVTFTVTSTCEPNKTCSATFAVTTAPTVVLTCPSNQTEAACQTQAAINTKFATWLASASFTGGCNATISNNNSGAPPACGGTATVTFTVTSSCEPNKTCSATFTVTAAPPVVLTCAANTTEAACQTQASINSKFSAWLATATFTGGCNAVISNNNTGAPNACGGTTTVTFTVTSSCEPNKTCSATFAVTTAPAVVLTCAANTTEAACQTQASINSKFSAWLATATFTGGCNAVISNNNTGAPNACGGTTTVTFTVTSSCEPNKTCSATFAVTTAPAVVLTCAANVTEAACQTQAVINSKFSAWLATATFTGGCNAVISNNNGGAPNACGGTVTVTFTVTSSCEPNKTCSATFAVTTAPAVVLTCPSNQTEAACQTQAAINAKFATWLTTASFSGGCNAVLSNNSGSAPNACGGTATVTFTVTSTCEPNKTCSATFAVTTAPAVVLTCPSNQTEAACQTQAAINAKFATWLTTASFSGGCNAVLSNNSGTAPLACGGTATVTFTVTSSCEPNKTCSATFAVTTAPTVVLTCPANQNEAACQTQAAIDAKFATWLASASFTGGCNAVISNNNTGAPPACGGVRTVTFTVTSSCEGPKTCVATFTVFSSMVVMSCAINQTEAACQTQAAINAKFTTWLATTTFAGGCNAVLSNNNTGAPNACGGTATVTFTVTSSCEGPATCSATFAVTAAPPVVLTCANNVTEAACQTQALINTKFNTWLSTANFTGGCNAVITNNNTGAPPACGGSRTVTFTVTSACEPNKTCSAVFTVTAAPVVVLTCANNVTEAACQTQATINSKFATWLTTATFTGGCNATISNNNTGAPPACGGTATVTFTVTSSCEPNKTCSATFTVTTAPAVVLTCPANVTEAACQTQSAIDTKFNNWLNTATFSGGCNAIISNNNTGAPLACGGSRTVTFTVTSSCEPNKTCSATFTVTAAPAVVLTCPANQTEAACQTQAAINSKFATWLTTATFSGGCNAAISNNNSGAPSACGGSKTVTFTVTSTCEPNKTCSAVFTVTAAPFVNLTCANNVTEAACQTQATINAKFATWLATASFTGGCNATLSNNSGSAPNACGGTVTVTFTVTSSCEGPITCSATFAVTTAPTVVLTCAANVTEAACQTQATINTKFAAWLATASFTGGCNGTISNNNTGAPPACGGTATVTFTVTSTCDVNKTCSATFTVQSSPVVLTCAANQTEAACQTQAAINAKFATWLTTATFTGGCNATISNNNSGAPSACGGTATVTFTVTSTCEGPKTCSATFTVTTAPPVVLTCANNVTEAACQTQANINTKFNTWLATATFTGGCSAFISNNNTGAPNACGGTVTVTFTVTSSCEPNKTCSATFAVTTAPAVVLTCANNVTEAACQTQASINSKFTTWLATATFSGGCNAVISNNNTGAPPACGGTVTVTFTVTSSCEPNKTCSATFAVTTAPAVVLTCPANVTEAACQTQGAIDTKFNNWLNTATFSGGCNAIISNNNTGAPLACGGSRTVTFTVTSTCEGPKTCSATFTVTAPPAVTLTCPTNQTEAACQTQAAIDAKFATWLTTATFGGGCNAAMSNNNTGAPPACGGTRTVTFTVTSTCEPNKTCSATFSVTAAPFVNLTCASNVTEAACQTQAAIDAKFATWLATASFTGGCNATLSNNNTGAPLACGGGKTVTFTVTSTCEGPITCTASFTVTAAPAVVLNCPANQTEAACQTQAAINTKFATWLATATFSGGCNATMSNNNSGAPPACGGTATVTFTVTSTCEPAKTCSATFTVLSSPVVLTCAANQTEAACQTQAAINTKFATWLTTATFTGGCNATISNNNSGAPPACGGTATVTFTVTSTCEGPKTCSATFTVTAAPPVVLTCANNVTEAACQTQATINTKFNTWLATATFTGGCSSFISNNNTGAPNACGGTVTVTFTVTSSCEPNKTCSATFAVTNAPAVVLTCANNVTEAACQTQAAINSKFNTWLATATFSGGCNATISNNNTGAPNACGGTVTVTFTVTSSCEPNKTCSATFAVTTAPAVVLTCANNVTEAACQTQAVINSKFATWLTTATFTGGCNATISNNSGAAPNACGGTVTVTFTVTSTCEPNKTCSATFAVTTAPAVVLTCPANQTEAACQTQAAINTKFATCGIL